MNEASTHDHSCDTRRIGRFLDGKLDADQELELERHLDHCSECRAVLESSAAEPAWWDQASDLLCEDPLDAEYERAFGVGRSRPVPTRNLGDMAQLILDALAPTDDPRMLGRLGSYEILGVIGSGGMGVVLKGYDAPLNRYVAIKVLAPHLASNGAARKRFAREAQAAAAVVHENVIAIYGVASFQGLPYLVMPYVSGPSLQRRLDESGPLPVDEILRIGHQVAAGLAAAHTQGLVHRDIKPANILLENGVQRVLITDFGLARAADDASLTRSGVIAGTPQYMSPEQTRGGPVDHRSDLFSLGSLLYSMCTGRVPFRADSPLGVLHRISTSEPRPMRQVVPEIPQWLCEIVERLHAKEPSERLASAAEVADLLVRWLAHLQQPLGVAAPERISRKHSPVGDRKRKLPSRLALAVAMGALVLLAGGVALLVPAILAGLGQKSSAPPAAAVDVSTQQSAATRRAVASPADAEAMERLWSDQALLQSYDEIHGGLLELDSQLSPPVSSRGNSFEREIADVDRQIEELGRQIDESFP